MTFCGHSEDIWWKEVMQWSYFFMSFFFFKAGYFNKSVLGTSSKAYCIDKFKRLMIPYLTTGLIGDAIYFAFLPFLLDRYGKPIEPLAWNHIWEKSSFYGNTPTWFLFSFFMAYIAIHFLERLRHWAVDKYHARRITTLSTVVYAGFPFLSYWLFTLHNPLWMSANNIFMGIFFFELGRIWHQVLDSMNKTRAIEVSLILIILFVAGNIVFHDAMYTMSSNKFDGNLFATLVNMICILCGLSGLLIATSVPRIPLINFIGQHSMVYFVGHYPILYYYKFTHLCFGRSIYGRYDDLAILIPAIFIICSWLVPYIESVPWLSGRWPKQEKPKLHANQIQ